MKQKISITIDEDALKNIDSFIDNIYIRNRSQAIEVLTKNALGSQKTAVILFGGPEEKLKIGKSYRIACKVNNASLIELGLKKLKENGFKEVFLIARKTILTNVFNIVGNGKQYGLQVKYVEERKSSGTGESLRLLKGEINKTFLVVYGDIIFNKINLEELWNQHVKQRATATLMLTTSSKPTKKGIVKLEGSKILEFQQKPKKTDIYVGFSSLFIAEPEIFEYRNTSLEEFVFPELAKKGLLRGHMSSEKEIHIHTKKDLKKAAKQLKPKLHS